MTAIVPAPQSPGLRARQVTYAILIGIETASIFVLTWKLMPQFWRIVDGLGDPQPLPQENMITVVISVIVFQISYWWRVRRMGTPFTITSRFVGHLFLFAGRLSFIFASTFASVVFFRHVPAVNNDVVSFRAGIRLIGFVPVLFSWFCYSLEIERLGKEPALKGR
jgi:hypothetical protein